MKLIQNVFVNSKANHLKLVDIYFEDRFLEIKIKADIDWSDISTIELKNVFINNYQTSIKHSSYVIDGKFLLAIPGAIDSHVHFDTPGFEFREDFEQASRAAAFGGTTTIIDMPCTSIPPVTNKINFNTKLIAVQNKSLIDYAFFGGVGGNCFEGYEKNITELAQMGIAGIKVYTISGMNSFTDLSYEQIKKAAIACRKNNLPLAVHAEDKSIVTSEENKRKSNNQNSWCDYTASRNSEAEVIAVKKLIAVARETDCKMVVVHLSTFEASELIWQAQQQGIKIFAETCPQYLYFTENDFQNENIRSFLKTAPPVKTSEDKEGLWNGIVSNKILFVNTDHAGCNPEEEKVSENYWEVYGGIPGVEHRAPFLFSEGFLKKKISLEQTINMLSRNQAEFFGIDAKGKIEKKYDADFALVNLWESEVVKAENMHCKGKYTPFEGTIFNSIIEQTFLHGELIMNRSDNYFAQAGLGRYIKIG